MTQKLFLEDSYLTEFEAKVIAVSDQGIELDQTAFYAMSGGQPGDIGSLRRISTSDNIIISMTRKGDVQEDVLHVPAEGCAVPIIGETVIGTIDWPRRYKHMRMHTCMHLLCALIVGDVTGGQISVDKGRLDFDIPGDAVDKDILTGQLNQLISEDHPVTTFWISEATLAGQPELIRTMSVKPPSEAGRIRLVRIGTEQHPVDLQPCGGTHVKSTAEIGRVHIAKIENKGRQNRRITVLFDEE